LSINNNIPVKEYTFDQTFRETTELKIDGSKIFADRLFTSEKKLLSGIVKTYNQSNLISIEEFKNGQLCGTTKYFHSNGNLFVSIEFKNDPKSPDIGYKHGKYITYDDDGEIEEVRFYKNNLETRSRKIVAKKSNQNELITDDYISEKSISNESVPDSPEKLFEWNIDVKEPTSNFDNENSTNKSVKIERKQNLKIERLFFLILVLATAVTTFLEIFNSREYYPSSIDSNQVSDNDNSISIPTLPKPITIDKLIKEEVKQANNITETMISDNKSVQIDLNIDSTISNTHGVILSYDTIIVEEKRNVDSTHFLVFELYDKKHEKKNIYRSIKRELKKGYGIKLSVKDIKLIINSRNQN